MRKTIRQFLRKGLCGVLCTAMLFSGISVPGFSVKAAEIDTARDTEISTETEIMETQSAEEESSNEESTLPQETTSVEETGETTEESDAEVTETTISSEEDAKIISDSEDVMPVSGNEITFSYYVGDTNEEVGLYYWGSITPGSSASEAGWTIKGWSDTLYLLKAESAYPGWYSINITINDADGESAGLRIYKKSGAESGDSEYLLKCDAWNEADIYSQILALESGSICIKDGETYSSIAEAEGIEEPVEEVGVNIYYYIADTGTVGGFYYWADEDKVITVNEVESVEWSVTNGGDPWNATIYPMETVSEHSGWYRINVTNTDTISEDKSTAGFTIYEKFGSETAVVGLECSGYPNANPDIYAKILARKNGENIFIRDGIVYDSIEEAEKADSLTLEQLEELVKEAKGYKAEDYKETGWKAFQDAIEVAETVIAKEDHTSTEIEEAYNNLKDAMDALKPASIAEAEINVEKVALANDFILGADISSYYSLKESGTKFYDDEENELDDQGFFNYLAAGGTNWVRIRVWNDPYNEAGNGYGGGNNDLDKAIAMGQWATKAGMKVLIDFHYSDFWADPGKQKAPKAWADKTLEEKEVAVKEFTKDCLIKLIDAGVDVGMVQVGNETNNGIAGETGAANMAKIFNAGSAAVKEVDPNILVALHFTNPEKSTPTSMSNTLNANKVDYDVFATSYYPYWHGTLDNLTKELAYVAKTYNKKVMVAETSWATTLEDGDGWGNTVAEGSNDGSDGSDIGGYNFSVQGQADEIRAVVNAANNVNSQDGVAANSAIGVFYWESAWISPKYAYDENGKKDEEVYKENQNLWEKNGSGWASSYATEYDPEDAGKWFGGSAVDNQAWFDFHGKALPTAKVYSYIRTGAEADLAVASVDKPSVTVEEDEAVEYPKTVTVTFNDGNTEDYDVIWNETDKEKVDVSKAGTYTVKGTVTINYTNSTGEQTDVRTVILTVIVKQPVGTNLLINPGFEDDGDALSHTGWTVDGIGVTSGADHISDWKKDKHSGNYAMHFYSGDPIDFTTKEKIEDLEAGVYTFGGYIQGDAKSKQHIMVTVYDKDGNKEKDYQSESESLSGWVEWQNPEIKNIVVPEGGAVEVGMQVASETGGAWGTLDDFYLYGTYAITVDDSIEDGIGTLTVNKEKAVGGQKIVVKAKPDTGYYLTTLTLTGKGINDKTLTSENGTISYDSSKNTITITYPEKSTGEMVESFTMPSGNVTISATFTSSGVLDDSELRMLIANCEKITDSSKYTEESWEAFSQALKAAQTVADNEDATQIEVNNAKNKLQAAYEGLETKVDFEELNNLIKQYENIQQDNYTNESWKAFKDALDTAKEIVAKDDATQAEVDKAKEDLQAAYDGLTESVSGVPDFTQLKELLDECEAIVKGDYTEASWKVFTEALSKAQAVADNEDATQAEINNAKNALEEAKNALKTNREESLEALKSLIADYEDTKQNNYTQDSWDAFQTALKEAQAVAEKEDATKEEADTAKENLESAYNALEESTSDVVDKSALIELITECEKITDSSEYGEASWEIFTKALNEAKTVAKDENATQAQINNAKNALEDAKNALKTPREESLEALGKLIEECKDKQNDNYTQESWEAFQKALNEAIALSEKADATKEEADAAKEKLEAAYKALGETIPDIVNKTDLNNLIAVYQDKTQDNYTDASWKVFQDALAAAKTVAGNESATQEEVDDAKNALQNAFNALISVPQGLWAEDIVDMTYTGSALKSVVKVYDGNTLLTSKDYSVSYKNNVKVSSDTDLASVVIKGKGNYTGSITKNFKIIPKSLEDEDIIVNDLYALVSADNTKAVTLKPVVSRNGKKLKLNKEYTIEKDDTQEGAYIKPGKYSVTIKAVDGSGYSGSKKINVTLGNKANCILMSSVKIGKINAQPYNEGNPIVLPELTVTYKSERLERGVHYEAECSDNTEAGETVTVTIKGIEGSKYIGEKTTTFKITGTPLKAKDVTLKDELTLSNITSAGVVYTGVERRPIVEINGESTDKCDVSYLNSKNAGKATVVITGKNGYTGTVKKTFKITAFDIKGNAGGAFAYAPDIQVPYAKGGSKLTDEILQAKFNDMNMVQGVDYTLSYSNNKKTGTATVKIKGKGNFKGTTNAIQFEVIQQDLKELKDVSAADILEKNAKKYNTVNPVVKDLDGKVLKKGTDYTLSYAACVPGGSDEDTVDITEDLLKVGTTIRVTITGNNYYKGTATTDFKIIDNNKSLSKATINVNEQYYTGNAIEPHGTEENVEDRAVKVSIKIKENGKTVTYDLQEGVDYIITGYDKNINKGTAKLTIRGMGEYGGTKTGTFKIKQQSMQWYEAAKNALLQLKERFN